MTVIDVRPGVHPALLVDGEWMVDPERSGVSFSGRASRFAPTMLARCSGVTGRIGLWAGTGEVAVDVDLTTVSTGHRPWDDLLAAMDPFDLANHPRATYRSTAVRTSGSHALVDGLLRLRGVGREVRLEVEHLGSWVDGSASFSATGEVDRDAFGVASTLPGCGLFMPRRLTLEVRVLARPF